jgi:hypothetical protein
MTNLDNTQSSPNQVALDSELPVLQPPKEDLWSENYLFALYDHDLKIGLWLHLGTVPTDWHLWEDRIYISLPDGGVFSMMAYHETSAPKRPAGSVMSFTCVEPFRHWKVRFDGFAWYTSQAAMDAGGEPRYRRRLKMELDVECVSPVWSANSLRDQVGNVAIERQSWATEHYEQLVIAQGNLELDGNSYALSATGWRDHSRGPRGRKSKDPWGGHVIGGMQFPSGKKFIFSRYWRPDGHVTMSGGIYIDEAGQAYDIEVVVAPELRQLVLTDEELPLSFVWDTGAVELTLTTTASIWIPRERKHVVGRDVFGELNDMYVLNWGPVVWGNELAHCYLERSAHLNALPESISVN